MNFDINKVLALHSLIIEWAQARNLIKGATTRGQTLKLASEAGELADAVLKTDMPEVKDGIGDCFVVICILCAQKGYNFANTLKILHGAMPVTMRDNNQDLALQLINEIGLVAHHELQKRSNINDFTHATLSIAQLAFGHGLEFEDCIQAAYDEIKDRKGVMYQGAFIKSTDPRYEGVMAELQAQ